jgi:hypothetical protein
MPGEETWDSLAERELRARRRTIRNLIVMLFATALLFMTVAVAIDVQYLSEGLGLIYGLVWVGFGIDAWRSHRVWSAAHQSKSLRAEADSIPTHDARVIEYTKDRSEEIIADANILILLFGTILVMAVITGVIAQFGAHFVVLMPRYGKGFGYLMAGLMLLLGLMALICLRVLLTEHGRLLSRIRELEFERYLQETNRSSDEKSAERLFFLNGSEIQRYYRLNLHQNTWIFCVGLICIGIGIAIIGATLYLVLVMIEADGAQGTANKVIVAAIGAVGTLATNFVGAMYLKMHAEAAKALNDFHQRLVNSHALFLGNVLASRISNQTSREAAFRDMANAIAGRG